MSALLHLPHELMLEILEHLFEDKDARIPSFTSLCRARRGLRVLAEPFLYRILDHIGPHHIQQISQKLLARPDLANHVRSVDIEFADIWIDDDDGDAADNVAACVGHIISATAKIEKLRLVYGSGARPSWWQFMELALDAHNPKLYHGYQHLRTVEIACLPGIYNAILIEPLYPIFQLPSLRSLEIRGCKSNAFARASFVPGWGDESEVPREDPWDTLESPVERLLVLKSELGNRTLDRLLRGCKALKHFHYEMDRLSFHQETLDYENFGLALACHSESLETLQIDFARDQAAQIWGFDSNVSSNLHALRRFQKLRSIQAPLNAILPMDGPIHYQTSTLGAILPVSTEEFSNTNKIQRHRQRFLQIKEFAENDLGRFPNLRSMHVRSTDPTNQNWTELAATLHGTGVTLLVD